MDTMKTILEDIKTNLQSKKSTIHTEITNYPTPIAGCDVHFNCLLEERSLISVAINQLGSIADDPAKIADFIETTPFINTDDAHAFLTRLRGLHAAQTQ